MTGKTYRSTNVYDAAKDRIRLVFRHFERVCVAFSGGKDSSVTLHLALKVAQEMGRGPVDALFIDLEGQYQATIAHVAEMFDRGDVRPWWVCLRLNLRNASSLHEPYWCTWDSTRKANWIRPMPTHPAVIRVHPFFRSTGFAWSSKSSSPASMHGLPAMFRPPSWWASVPMNR
ncbi:MAG: Co-activator of prophage gene expression IbrA [uncultured Caballeronia sp.]|nr:MAG: Co-activator of prophage gene expression IbrA [uncultured Caballeronia sp.]